MLDKEATAPQEYLSKDMFEESFLEAFWFLHRVQYLIGSSRVDARDRFATPPSMAQKCYSIFCVLDSIWSYYGQYYFFVSKMFIQPMVFYMIIASMSIQFTIHFVNVIHVRFLNNDDNVQFLVKMQQIDRLLKINEWPVFNAWMKALNNISVTFLLILISILLALVCYENGSMYIIFCPVFGSLSFILDLTASSGHISYFILRMRFVNCLLENHLARKNPRPLRHSVFYSIDVISKYAHDSKYYYATSDTTVYLSEIFKCFKMFQDLYRFQLFVFCVQSVLMSLVLFQATLCAMQEKMSQNEMAGFIVYTILNVAMSIFLSLRYELFHYEVRKTKRLCIQIMAKHHTGPQREKARKMMKLIEESPPRLSVYGMWEVNANSFVGMFAIITGFYVTLLQFAFL